MLLIITGNTRKLYSNTTVKVFNMFNSIKNASHKIAYT